MLSVQIMVFWNTGKDLRAFWKLYCFVFRAELMIMKPPVVLHITSLQLFSNYQRFEGSYCHPRCQADDVNQQTSRNIGSY
jgi:hypothetical protein